MKVAGSIVLVTGANLALGLALWRWGREGLRRGAQYGGGYSNGSRAAETSPSYSPKIA
jgi:hypothetical protein